MPTILALVLCLQSCLTITTVRHLTCITAALLTMTGRVTMLSVSRWSGKVAQQEGCIVHAQVSTSPYQ